MLAAGTNTLLRCDGTVIWQRLDTGEHVLELDHPGVREQQSRIIVRHERRRRHDLMAGPSKIFQEPLPNLVRTRHAIISKAYPRHQSTAALGPRCFVLALLEAGVERRGRGLAGGSILILFLVLSEHGVGNQAGIRPNLALDLIRNIGIVPQKSLSVLSPLTYPLAAV